MRKNVVVTFNFALVVSCLIMVGPAWVQTTPSFPEFTVKLKTLHGGRFGWRSRIS